MNIQVTEDQKKLLDELAKLGWLKIPDGIGFDTVSKDRGETAGAEVVPPAAAAAVVSTTSMAATPTVSSASVITVVNQNQKKRFTRAFDWLIPWEGTIYENVPGDPGGPTKFGLTWRDDHAAMEALGVKDLKDLTIEQAGTIYWQKYWMGNLCSEMSAPVSECHFNYGVNVGNMQSVKFMQRALGGLLVDGWYGPKTQEALRKMDTDERKRSVAHDMIGYADRFYRGLGEKMPQFLKGWLNRNDSLRKFIDTVSVS